MPIIKKIEIREILNSIGKNAIEIEMCSDKGTIAIASSPSAIVPGNRENNTNYMISEKELEKFFNSICNNEIVSQLEFDELLTKNIDKVGTNIILPLSLAYARIASKEKNINLIQYITSLLNNSNDKTNNLKPLVTIFSGGVHDKRTTGSIQNIMLSVNIQPFSNAVKAIQEIYSYIEKVLVDKNLLVGYGASSGMLTKQISTEKKFELVSQTINKFGYEKEVSIAIDVAAEHIYKKDKYFYEGQELDYLQFKKLIQEYVKKYNITYIEDPFDTENIRGWKEFKAENPMLDIVGDDLFATQEEYIDNTLANGILLKMNQVGTLSGTIKAYEKAIKSKMKVCVSHRSIETEDTFMCDLAIALKADYVKIGGPRRGDRIAKYNRLLRLEKFEI